MKIISKTFKTLHGGGLILLLSLAAISIHHCEYPGTGEKELYDLQIDKAELISRHADPAYDEIRANLAQELQTLQQ